MAERWQNGQIAELTDSAAARMTADGGHRLCTETWKTRTNEQDVKLSRYIDGQLASVSIHRARDRYFLNYQIFTITEMDDLLAAVTGTSSH